MSDRGTAPRVSVVIPAYNHAAVLPQTLKSVFGQSFTDWEVIVVNDGSPDDTAGLLRPLAESGRIRYVEQENAGQGAARNRGIELARGKYVALLDDDDLWPPNKLAWQVEALDSNPGAVLVYGTHDWLEPDGSVRAAGHPPRPSGWVHRDFLKGCWLLSPGQSLIRRSALRAVGGFDPAIWGSDDWDLYIRLAERGTFIFSDRVALHYREHSGSASRRALQHVRNHFKVVRKHLRWDAGLILDQFERGGLYFLPNLRRFEAEARQDGKYAAAVQARLYAAVFNPLAIARLRRVHQALHGGGNAGPSG